MFSGKGHIHYPFDHVLDHKADGIRLVRVNQLLQITQVNIGMIESNFDGFDPITSDIAKNKRPGYVPRPAFICSTGS